MSQLHKHFHETPCLVLTASSVQITHQFSLVFVMCRNLDFHYWLKEYWVRFLHCVLNAKIPAILKAISEESTSKRAIIQGHFKVDYLKTSYHASKSSFDPLKSWLNMLLGNRTTNNFVNQLYTFSFLRSSFIRSVTILTSTTRLTDKLPSPSELARIVSL